MAKLNCSIFLPVCVFMHHNGISPLSYIHPNAIIGNDVTISPFAFIDDNVVVGDNSWIGPNANLMNGTRIGKNCKIFPGAVIAGTPQDLKFNNEITTAEIGDFTTVRECATVNRGTSAAGKTSVGSHCLLMAYSHVAHDCSLGNHVILANNVALAGHIQIDDWAILEGLVAVQQFIHIGPHTFIAGGSLVRKNIPPYVRVANEPLQFIGVNQIGLNRRGFSAETIEMIDRIYTDFYTHKANLLTAEKLNYIENEYPNCTEKQQILTFIKSASNGVVRGPVNSKTSVNNAN